MTPHCIAPCWPVGSHMQQMNLAWFARLGVALERLNVDGLEDHGAAVARLQDLANYLLFLGDEKLTPLSLRASRPYVWSIFDFAQKVIQAATDEQAKLIDAEKGRIYEECKRLITILDSDLSHQMVYLLDQKRAYSVQAFLADATQLFSDEVRKLLTPDESYDFREAGKCLAFEVPTAAGLHLFRGSESILRRYYKAVVGSLPAVKARNWGAYIRVLKKNPNADAKVLVVLEQVKDLYRNPLVHPEEKLTMEQALSLVGLIETLLSLLATEIVKLETVAAVAKAEF